MKFLTFHLAGKKIYDISAERGRDITRQKQATLRQKPAYKQSMEVIQNWLNANGGRGNFSDWWIRTAKAEDKPNPGSFIRKNPQLISVALMDTLLDRMYGRRRNI